MDDERVIAWVNVTNSEGELIDRIPVHEEDMRQIDLGRPHGAVPTEQIAEVLQALRFVRKES